MKAAKGRVVVGLSGGVDSSVAALLLRDEGYEVVGVFMQNWDEQDEEGLCTSDEDYQDVRHVCSQLDIPYYTVNFTQQYWDRVFTYFLDEYKAGRTPNPDVLCNKEIKFKAFLEFAQKIRAEHIATGHYARKREAGSMWQLLKGYDKAKDQSYFLHQLNQEQLQHTLFPIGHLCKDDVRRIAREHHLSVAEKKGSTGICFIGERNFKRFLSQYLPAQPGDIVTVNGDIVGRHDGLMYYTIGQRKGMGIGGNDDGRPYFVVDKHIKDNHLIVQQGEGGQLLSNAIEVRGLHVIGDIHPADLPGCNVKIRYRQPDQAAIIKTHGGDEATVLFEKPQRAVAPGQFAVFYQGDICLGGGVIHNTMPQ